MRPSTLIPILLMPAVAGQPLSPAERERNLASFEQVWNTVRNKHWDPKLNGLDWQAVHDELRPRIEQAASMEKARAVLEDLLGRLKQSHFGILASDTYAHMQPGAGSREGTTGVDVRLIGGRVLVTSVEKNSPAAGAGIRPGWELVGVDGREVAPLAARISKALAGSTLLGVTARSAVLLQLAGEPGSTAELRLRDEAGRTLTRPVERVRPRGLKVQFGYAPPLYVWSEWRRLEGGIAFVAFNLFMDPERVMKTIEEAVKSCGDCRGLIIDLRGNPGGIGIMATGVAGWLVEEKGRRLGTMRTRETSIDFVVFPRPVTWRRPVAVLVDDCTGSTAEIFAGGMQDLKRARIFGSRTAGAALPAVIERLPNGDGFMYAIADYVSQGGRRLEGAGVTPDVEVGLSRESLLAGRDAALEAALAWLGAR